MTAKRIAANKARRIDLSGKKFNRLTVIKYYDDVSKYLCVCDCGNKTEARAAALKNGNTKSCGCLQKERASKAAIGKHKRNRKAKGLPENQPISRKNTLERLLLKDLISDTLVRDGYTCILCSQVGGQLQAHHIDSWSEFPNRRSDPDNLVTLCKSCHYVVHDFNWFGEPNYLLNILLKGYVSVMKEKINEPV